MHVFDDMKAYLGFDPVTDGALLRAFWPRIVHRTEEVSEHFYERALSSPGAARVLRDPDQVRRLMVTLQRWMRELCEGPWDRAYYERRQRIGRVHVQVGLQARYMFVSMAVVREKLCDFARELYPAEKATKVCRALCKVTELDLAIMTGTYMNEREERQLATIQEIIVDHMPVAVLLVDKNRRITLGTRTAAALLSVDHPEGKMLIDVLPEDLVRAASLEHHIRGALAEHRQVSLPRVDVETEERVHSYGIDLVPVDHPRASLLVHLEDLTQTVETESRLRRSETLAQLGSLSAVVAHELRNPLAGMSAALQIIERSLELRDRRKAVLGRVQEQIGRLNDLVTDLLAFAKPQTARLVDLDLREAVLSVVAVVEEDHPGVVVRVEGDGRASADKNRLHQVLINLLQNAVQAVGDRGEVLVRVGESRVLINDDGPGIAFEHRKDVFTPFFTTRIRGTGLGLAISRKAARSMEGELRLDRGPLSGAAFLLLLKSSVSSE